MPISSFLCVFRHRAYRKLTSPTTVRYTIFTSKTGVDNGLGQRGEKLSNGTGGRMVLNNDSRDKG